MSTNDAEYTPNWSNDVLNRSDCAKFLTKYLNSLYDEEPDPAINSDSFVLCLNAEWGYGKTFLIKNWADDLKNDLNHPVVYFDAWQNDFSDDPLLAFISELEHSLTEINYKEPKGSELIKNVIDLGKGAIAPALKTTANIFLKNIAGASSEEFVQIFNAASENAIDTYVTNALERHNNRKAKVRKFSHDLQKLLKNLKEQGFSLPMYVFIDELDRCKPSYAIQLLEGIKHIFGTPGVFFLVATNKTQLSKSIKAVYGAEFDSLGYLQRFFDQEYRIPQPDFERFSVLLIQKYRLTDVQIESLELKSYGLAETFAILAKGFDLSLRSQDQVAKQLKAIILGKSIRIPVHHWYLLFLLMLKTKSELAYDDLLSQSKKSDELENLKKYFNISLEINGFVPTDNGYGSKPHKISVISIIREYFDLENTSAVKLREQWKDISGTIGAIKMQLKAESPDSYNSERHYPLSISFYPKLLLQTGQLS